MGVVIRRYTGYNATYFLDLNIKVSDNDSNMLTIIVIFKIFYRWCLLAGLLTRLQSAGIYI